MSEPSEPSDRLRSLNRNIADAIRCYELFAPTGQDRSLIDHVNATGLNPGFNIISDALHREAIAALCRIHEQDRATTNLQSVAKTARKAVGRESVDAVVAIEDKADALRRSPEFRALLRLRNEVIAHTADQSTRYHGQARGALYGDERFVVESTIPLIEELNALLGMVPPIDYADLRGRWRAEATKFWSALGRR